MKIAIAGASGFLGQELIKSLHGHTITALSRSKKTSQDTSIKWQVCDLFSLKDCEESLQDIEVAIYLVHSMLPSAHLSQGHFSDFDLLLADNFARACTKNGVKKIIYVSGLIPQGTGPLSNHLASRLEVEEVFRSYPIPSVALRAGVILGEKGSSYQMMYRLVKNLPLMLCPSWTQSKCEVVALEDVILNITKMITHEFDTHFSCDLGNGVVQSYAQLMLTLAQVMGKKRKIIFAPLFFPRLSTWWIFLITKAPRSLTIPLVKSLQHDLVAQKNLPYSFSYLSTEEALTRIVRQNKATPQAFSRKTHKNEEVRSIQRLGNYNISAEDVATHYMRWLSDAFRYIFAVKRRQNTLTFYLFNIFELLILTYSPERSSEKRNLFYIKGGLLAKKTSRGRLEFRILPYKNTLISALHEYRPRLPWFIYIFTQAQIHQKVMYSFGKFLKKSLKNSPRH